MVRMVRMVQKDVYILYSDLPLKSRNNVMHPRYSSSMHSFGAMKVAFYKASLLRKRSALDKSKRKYEWSEWSKRTYTYYIVSYHCKVGIMLCILDTLACSMHFSEAMKILFFKVSLLRKRKLSIIARVNTNGPNGPKGRLHTI